MSFPTRHIGINYSHIKHILSTLNTSKQDIITNIIPNNIRYDLKPFGMYSEEKSLSQLKGSFKNNVNNKYLIGLDFNDSILPNVIKRNLLENPKWYTAYTPYQSEISQGRLESLFNYQTMISEITGLPISNCSLLDTGSASNEALNMAFDFHRHKKTQFFLDKNVHPHIKEIINTRSKMMDIELIIDDFKNIKITDNLFGAFFSYPDTNGNIDYFENILLDLKQNDTTIISQNDLMSLLLLKSPGELGIDISLGTTQRFGLPLWYGGPHSAFFATTDKYIRYIPGRLVGETIDRNNDKCYRLALQTREQHIKKERASSSICTSQALLANVSSMYAVYHGKDNLIDIAKTIAYKTLTMRYFIEDVGYTLDKNKTFFDTFSIKYVFDDLDFNPYAPNNNLSDILENQGFYVRNTENGISISVNESLTNEDCLGIINNLILQQENQITNFIKLQDFEDKLDKIRTHHKFDDISVYREDNFLEQDIFKDAKTETEMVRYLNKLANKDYSLVHGMIPLGSCTMKLNSTTELEPLSWNELQNYHPFLNYIPDGYKTIIDELSEYLLNVTNMKSISFQTNAGSLGEYAGLSCIKKYHENNNQSHRNICLIPDSAHGTNFASARLNNLKIVKFSDNLDTNEFEKLVIQYKDNLSCLMITYPNTYGIFNKNIKQMCDIIHQNGGLVYMDGANMNAQSGLTSPGTCGADVCHLNLHKTFCIPHGGGGPGMGPICVNEKLTRFLPSNILTDNKYSSDMDTIGMITSSNYSSAALMVIPYLYFKTMGSDGIKNASIAAILNANYLKKKLEHNYTIHTTNDDGFVGHEFIINLNEFREYGITDKDIAKRLIDYSFHPPTMSWPVPGSLMIEPTESEDLKELDRFVDAMNSIYDEIMEIKNGVYSKENNVLVNSPHSYSDLVNWNFDYSIEKAMFPLNYLKNDKFWPSNPRINDIHGDKNIILKLKN
jgi:glycine dehydrogenase